MSLIIHAPNVHRGGGKTLLLALLRAAMKQCAVTAILDERLVVPEGVTDAIRTTRVRSSIWRRLVAEWQLTDTAHKDDTVLCFGNLPPLFRLRARTVLFLQNCYLVRQESLNGFPLVTRLRIMVERLWLSWRARTVDRIVVQTPSMQRQAAEHLGRSAEVIAFFDGSGDQGETRPGRSETKESSYDFLYVASGEPHKNHMRLIDAWELLGAQGVFPILCLTVEEGRYPDVVQRIRRAKSENGIRIENVSALTTVEIENLYQRSRAIIYPSTLESFGLPLVEARRAGLPIIAGELDYVRDVVEPDETFDPRSAVSIARAVRRYLGAPERPLPVMSAERFVKELLTTER